MLRRPGFLFFLDVDGEQGGSLAIAAMEERGAARGEGTRARKAGGVLIQHMSIRSKFIELFSLPESSRDRRPGRGVTFFILSSAYSCKIFSALKTDNIGKLITISTVHKKIHV